MAKGISKILIAVLVIAVLCVSAISGLTIGSWHIYPVLDEEHGIRKNFDLAGGSVIVYQASEEGSDGGYVAAEASGSQMDAARDVLVARLDRLGILEGNVTVKGNMLEVMLPSVQDTATVIDELGKSADFAVYCFDSEAGQITADALLVGSEITGAVISEESADEADSAQYAVNFKISEDALQRYEEATAEYGGETVLTLNGVVLSTVHTVEDGYLQTETIFDLQHAEEVLHLIQDGQLPFHLSVIQQRTAGPALGEHALQNSLNAILIGLLFVFLFMILYYRLPGLAASVALVFYVVICCLIYAALRMNLSLPGVAGFVLSIGMAVDANVIIFERMKEEFKLGKTLKATLKNGFKRAFVSIFHSRFTMLIASGVLYFCGSDSIKGFATTLGVGILVSVFTAIFVTKFLLRAMLDLKIKKKFLYGAPRKGGGRHV